MKHLTLRLLLSTLLTLLALRALQAAPPQLTADQQAKVNDAVRLNTQMMQLAGAGKYSEAIPLAEKVVAIQKQVYGLKNINTAVALNSLGFVLQEKGDFEAAKSYFEQALTIREEVSGTKDVATAQSLNNLGLLLQKMGDHENALKNLEEAFKIYSDVRGTKHLDTALALSNLGFLYQEIGDYAAARKRYEAALAIRREIAGPEDLATAQSLTNLGGLQVAMGDYSAAKVSIEQALAIFKKKRGVKHPETALSLNQLASLLQATENYAAAKPLYEQSLAIRRDVLGPKHPATAQSLNNLGFLHEAMGDYQTAKSYSQQALDIYAEILPNLPDTARSQNNLAVLLMEMGEGQAARPHYDEALRIYRDVYPDAVGKQHPDVAKALGNLATFEASLGNWRVAGEQALESRKIIHEHVANVLPSLSQQQQLLFVKAADRKKLNAALTLGLHQTEYPPLAALSAEFLANAKAVIQESLADQAKQKLESSDPTIQKLVKELTVTRTRLATLANLTPKPGEIDKFRAELRTLENREHELAARVNAALQRPVRTDSWTTLDKVRKSIPQKAMLVDLARIELRNYNAKAHEPKFQPAHYVAWLTPHTDERTVQVIDLGKAENIDAAVQKYQDAFRDCQSPDTAKNPLAVLGEPEAEKRLRTSLAVVGRLVLDPLLPQLNDKVEIILSPDANLWLVPWAALPVPGKGDEYAIEKWNIHYVISARELAPQVSLKQGTDAPAIMADPDYDADPTRPGNREKLTPTSVNLNRSIEMRATDAQSIPKVKRLPGTLIEAGLITPSLEKWVKDKAAVITGERATEGIFKRVHSPRVMVLSTHGFFFPDQELASGDKDRSALGSERESKQALADKSGNAIENPLLRCGMLFAGVNNRHKIPISDRDDVDDGILTGMEIVNTDLRGTELVVLSACETGLGQVNNGEGVAGLRQAFQLAGARSVVATLWQIPDKQSAQLMNDFFGNLAAGQSKSDALRTAQLAMIKARREKFNSAHPFFWAAFTLTGE